MNKVAFIIPIHPPKKNDFIFLLKSYNSNNNYKYIDLYLIFSSNEDKIFFNDFLNDEINYIILPNNINFQILDKEKSYINFKKLYALNYINENFNYNYSIIIDCDCMFLDMKNIYIICERFCKKKEIYGTTAINNDLLNINNKTYDLIEYFYREDIREDIREEDIREDIREEDIREDIREDIKIIDTKIYFWYSQMPIYDMNNVKEFINFIDLNNSYQKLSFFTFDYIIYIYYCVIYKSYKIINLNELDIYTSKLKNWSLECNLDIYIFNKLKQHNIEINWQYYNYRDCINNDICILYHTDRNI